MKYDYWWRLSKLIGADSSCIIICLIFFEVSSNNWILTFSNLSVFLAFGGNSSTLNSLQFIDSARIVIEKMKI